MLGDGDCGKKLLTKPICSICYEDLKPVIEDLQSISVCGHVFHELCLQQWFEYCPNAKKRCCPVCKRACANAAAVGRLYFQSVSDPNDSSNPSQKPCENENRITSLEVSRLENKVLALSSTLEIQQKQYNKIEEQLLSCKEQLKEEVALKNEAITKMSANQELLRIKSDELNKSTSECMRLQEKNMALAKELAAVKLASDITLEEDEVMKLASLGNAVGSSETVDVLRKSLVLRNKSYKELMAKCNVLGRGEAKCRQKLEKANEKIRKLKMTVQELETAIEIKDNATLRGLTDSHVKRPRIHIDLDQEECASIPPPCIERNLSTAKKIDDCNNTRSSSSPAGRLWQSKWCNNNNKAKDQNLNPGGLIAEGADGRGGRIKVIRPFHEQQEKSKIITQAPKPVKIQGQGCLQIEHFFSKAGK